MIQLTMDAEAVARSRFVISPLHELCATLLAWGHAPHPDAEPWLARARRVLRAERLPLLNALAIESATGYVPDFLCPHPAGPVPTIEEQLAQVAATPAERVVAELEAVRLGRPASGLPARDLPAPVLDALARGGRPLAQQAADELGQYWRRAFAPHWGAARAAMEGEIARRAAALAAHGSAALFASLHPAISWEDGVLRIESRYAVTRPAPMVLLTPSLIAKGVGVAIDPVYDTALRPPVISYPMPRLAPPGIPAAPEQLGHLLGPTRADLLASLRTPATTQSLAARHFLSPATVSYHLGILRRSGLVTSERSGRAVLYRRTPQGSRLTTGR